MTAFPGIRFGVHAGLQNTTTGELADIWRLVEDAGYSWISIWDHFYAAAFSDSRSCLEATATHTALAVRTSRVRCGCLMYSAMFRHPSVLAKTIATIDQLSEGRCEVGLGAGWFEQEATAFGIAFPPLGVRFDMLEEAVQVLRLLLHDEVASFAGKYYQLDHAHVEPRPVQARVPIWMGGGGERRTLPLAARFADGWNLSFVSPETYAAKREVLLKHCAAAFRDPSRIRCSVNVGLARDAARLWEEFGTDAESVRAGVVVGGKSEAMDRVQRYVDAGATEVNISMRAPFDRAGIEDFAEWVLH